MPTDSSTNTTQTGPLQTVASEVQKDDIMNNFTRSVSALPAGVLRLSAFAAGPGGGNPAGVVLDAFDPFMD